MNRLLMILGMLMLLAGSSAATDAVLPMGDLDGDGAVTADDTRLLARVLAGYSAALPAGDATADLDGSGAAGAVDLALIARKSGGGIDYRREMRWFVGAISRAARPGCAVIPQNGQELLTVDGTAAGAFVPAYLDAITGIGREDAYYGYDADNAATPADVTAYFEGFMDRAAAAGRTVMVIDYCSDPVKMDDSYATAAARGYISFAADHRDLDNIPAYPPAPFRVHGGDVASLADARNFLYLINPGAFGDDRAGFLATLAATDFDLVLVDLFFNDGAALTPAEVSALKTKARGGRRLVVAYLSIGEAEDYRYYWRPEWAVSPPAWLGEENPDWPGNYKVDYWHPGWQAIIRGGAGSYLQRILDAGFDGVYLDLIDAFECYETR
ncbi:MAG: hypothetical protein GX414_10470 [Acidobacteria bacterium]|nr:hypothetical protein [Acidobacteriota bacterium]